MKLVVKELLAHIQVALKVPFPESPQHVLDGQQPIVWYIQVHIEPTTDAVVHHSNVSLTLVHAKIMFPTCDLPRLDVPSTLHLHHLVSHQFVLEGVLGLGLFPQERLPGRAHHKMWLPIPHFTLICQPPIPEEGGRALTPIKP
jgi:hypothetical protein